MDRVQLSRAVSQSEDTVTEVALLSLVVQTGPQCSCVVVVNQRTAGSLQQKTTTAHNWGYL